MGTGPADDYYALLGIDAEAGDAELRRAWRRLALQWHPDHAGPAATATFQKLLAAYHVLADPDERAAYDRRRGTSARGPGVRAGEPASTSPPAPRRRAPGVMLQRLSRPLNVLLTCGIARQAADDLIELFLDEDEASQGGMVTIPMRVPVRCPACAAAAASASSACSACGGSRTAEELFSAWLAVPPEVAEGTLLRPSALLPGMRPVSFRVRLGGSAWR